MTSLSSNVLQGFKVGQIVEVYYRNGKFSLLNKQESQELSKLAKGDLVLSRFVKAVTGKGCTC